MGRRPTERWVGKYKKGRGSTGDSGAARGPSMFQTLRSAVERIHRTHAIPFRLVDPPAVYPAGL